MRSKHYCIPVNPIPWQRAGINGKRFFDRQENDKVSFGLILRDQHGFEPLFSGPLRFDVVFYIKRPKNKQRQPSPWHITTPDFDNYLKFLSDSMNSVIWEDDKYVCAGSWLLIYDENPRTEFTITELKDDPINIIWNI
jgi:Holliday junction resolvase RusA-like endonuclease